MTGTDSNKRRGQVIVIGGLLLAATLLTLATVLNGAVFTGELATRRGAVGEDSAIGYQQSTERGLAGVVFYANYYNYSQGETLHETISRRVGRWSRHVDGYYGINRVAATVESATTTNGSYVYQDRRGTFEETNGGADWTLATDVGGTRRLSMNVTRASLVEPASTASLGDITDADPFYLTVTNGTATTRVFVYERDDRIVVRVATADDGLRPGACSTAAANATIDITEGEVAGERCQPLTYPAVSGDYDIAYRNGDSITGRYGLVVDVPKASLDTDVYTSGGGPEPHAVPAVYAVAVNLTYTTNELGYTTTQRIVPEGPPQGHVYGVYDPFDREPVFVTPSGWLRSIDRNRTLTTYDAPDVEAIGPKKADFDGDGRREVPYVNASGTLKTVDDTNESRALATDVAQSKTLLGVGTWGSDTFDTRQAVFYVDSADGAIHRAWYDGGDYDTQLVRSADGDGDGISSVAGIADYNGDGDTDIVFTDGSNHVTYIDGGTTHETDEGVGQNNGIGVGEPQDFDGDGSLRAPIVDGSGNVALLPDSGVSEDLTSSGPAKKSPVAGAEWDSSASGREVIYIDSSSGTLHYVTQSRDKSEIRDASGATVDAADTGGVA